MEQIANEIANKISKELNFDEEKRQVINYGLIAIVQMIVLVGIAFIFGLILGVPLEVIIACVSVSSLRKYTGGAHASSIEFCTLTGIVVSTAIAFVGGRVLPNIISDYAIIILIFVIYSISIYTCYKKVPIDSPNKPIKSIEKRARMKKGAIKSLGAFLVISIVLFILGKKANIFVGLNLSLLFGISWQVFTMTEISGKILGQIEKITNIIIFRKGMK